MLEKAQLSEVDLLVGGPPCQGLSSAGAKDWTDPRNILVRKFVEIITTIRPTWFIMENVEGFLTANNGLFITETITRFLEAGYWVRVKKIYMEQHGLPQRRKRVFIVGNLEQCSFYFPLPTHFDNPTLPAFNGQFQLTLLDAIDDLPDATEAENVFYDKNPRCDYQQRLRGSDSEPIFHHQIKQLNNEMLQRICYLQQGETMKQLPAHLQHPSFTRRSYRRVMDGTPTEKRGGAPSGLKRLIASQPSLTITSASPTEFIHPVENRPLTLRECARIQSFPDQFVFHGSGTSIATQIGNAIPPLFMQRLASHLQQLATWRRIDNSQGRWLGIDATKSQGMSPALMNMLTKLKEQTYTYANL